MFPLTFTPPLTSNDSLDVSGSVNVSGTITAGNAPFKVHTFMGTTPSAGTDSTFSLPSVITFTNINSLTGMANYNNYVMPANTTYNGVSFNWGCWVLSSGGSPYCKVGVPTGSAMGSTQYTITIITSS